MLQHPDAEQDVQAGRQELQRQSVGEQDNGGEEALLSPFLVAAKYFWFIFFS